MGLDADGAGWMRLRGNGFGLAIRSLARFWLELLSSGLTSDRQKT